MIGFKDNINCNERRYRDSFKGPHFWISHNVSEDQNIDTTEHSDL